MQVRQALFLQSLWRPQNIHQMSSLEVKAVSLTKEFNLDKQVLVIALKLFFFVQFEHNLYLFCIDHDLNIVIRKTQMI